MDVFVMIIFFSKNSYFSEVPFRGIVKAKSQEGGMEEMRDYRAKDILCRYFIYFMLYSIIGWCYEVFLEVVVYRWGFTNRGVLFGPYCPVYGVGATIFLILLYPMLKERTAGRRILLIPVIFLLSMTIATVLELLTSYILEYVSGSWPWQTYADYRFNFQGRIALSPSLRFGLGGVIFLYLLQPLFEGLCDRLGTSRTNRIALAAMVIVGMDCIFTFFLK